MIQDAARLTGVSLGFGRSTVLHGVDLALRQDEFVGLLGPNGAGKTTLLKALAGLVRPCSGRIEVAGTPARPGHQAVRYLPQAEGPLPAVRVFDLLALSLHGPRWGLPRCSAADRAEITRALRAVDAEVLAARPITQLSGGERQRVLIAQALLGAPRLLLLDEPLAGLDPAHQQSVVAMLRDLQRRFGLTLLCSAHDLNVLLPAVDRVLYLGGGRAALGNVEQVVTPAILSALYGAPMQVVALHGGMFVVPDGRGPAASPSGPRKLQSCL